MLNKEDILLLKEAKTNGLTLDQTIINFEKIVARNELRDDLQQILMRMQYIAQDYIWTNIEAIEKLPEADRLNFIITESYKKYLAQKQEEETLQSNQSNNENPSE